MSYFCHQPISLFPPYFLFFFTRISKSINSILFFPHILLRASALCCHKDKNIWLFTAWKVSITKSENPSGFNISPASSSTGMVSYLIWSTSFKEFISEHYTIGIAQRWLDPLFSLENLWKSVKDPCGGDPPLEHPWWATERDPGCEDSCWTLTEWCTTVREEEFAGETCLNLDGKLVQQISKSPTSIYVVHHSSI